MPADWFASRGDVPAHPAIPYSCPADEGGHDVGEYGDDGLYLGGPQLAQPETLKALIAAVQASLPPDLRRLVVERQIAEARTLYRQSLPIPIQAAASRQQRRKGLGRRGYLGLLDQIRGAA